MSKIDLDSEIDLNIKENAEGNFTTAIKFYENDKVYNCFANTFNTEENSRKIILPSGSEDCDHTMFNITIPYTVGPSKVYKTSEHYFQAGKANNLEDYTAILNLKSGNATQKCIAGTKGDDCKTHGGDYSLGTFLGIHHHVAYWDSSKSGKPANIKIHTDDVIVRVTVSTLVQPTWWTNYKYENKMILPLTLQNEMDYKCGRMFNALLFKYGMNNPSSIRLRKILEDTGDKILIEHTPMDAVWGDCKGSTKHNPDRTVTPDYKGIYYTCNQKRADECSTGGVNKKGPTGCNYLGRMLMVIRHILIKNPDKFIDSDEDFYEMFFIKGVHVPDTLWSGGDRIGDPKFAFTRRTTTSPPTSTASPKLSQTPTANVELPQSIKNILQSQNGEQGTRSRRYPSYNDALQEMTSTDGKPAKKVKHWMWYIFPTLLKYRESGDGFKIYSFEDLTALEMYLLYPELNQRLQEITEIVTKSLSTDLKKLHDLFDGGRKGNTDTIKFKQSMLTYIFGYCNLILKLTDEQLIPINKEIIENTLKKCSTALAKMGLTDLTGKLTGDGDFNSHNEKYFLNKLKEVGLESEITELIGSNSITIEDFIKNYLAILESKFASIQGQSRQGQSRQGQSRQGQSRQGESGQPRQGQPRSDSSLPLYKTRHPSNKFMLRLVGELGEVGDHTEFKRKCIEDVSKLLNIPLTRVVIKEALRRGSIKVYVEIINQIGNIIVTDDDIKELLRSESINGKDVSDIHITQRHVLKHAEKISFDEHLRDNRQSNKIHLDIREQYAFDIQDIKSVISNKSNDYVFVYNLNIPGLEEVNYKEKKSVLNRFLDS